MPTFADEGEVELRVVALNGGGVCVPSAGQLVKLGRPVTGAIGLFAGVPDGFGGTIFNSSRVVTWMDSI